MSLVKMSDEHFGAISLVDKKFLHSSVITSKPRPMLSTIYLHLHIVYFSYNIQISALLQKNTLICSCDKVMEVAFVSCRWLCCLKGNVSGGT